MTALGITLLLLLATGSAAQQGNRFMWAQLQYAGVWDPYPEVHRDILDALELTTSIRPEHERRVLKVRDPLLYSSPFVILAGQSELPPFSEGEVLALRRFLQGGGFLWIEDTSGVPESAFSRSVQRELVRILPAQPLQKIAADHALYRSFYLLRKGPSGRFAFDSSLKGIEMQGLIRVIFSVNDMLGAWERDRLGNYRSPCEPGGDVQRWEAMKLTINMVMYALTGTYKADAIHQPFIDQKLRN